MRYLSPDVHLDAFCVLRVLLPAPCPFQQILDILVRAASELAGWSTPGSGGSGPSQEFSSGGGFPSALMQEARGATPQGSIRRQQQQQQQLQPSPESGSAVTGETAEKSGEADGGGSSVATGEEQQQEGTGRRSRRQKGVLSVAGTTRRWGYRRGPREQLRRNLFGRLAPVFFYPLAQVRFLFRLVVA